jgi:arylsulfatase A-like enzyme/Tfp pilus assembly protein PilF
VSTKGPVWATLAVALVVGACGSKPAPPPPETDWDRPSILLVTLDTTRADVIGPEAEGAVAPNLSALAERGRWFAQAYTTAPMTLPAHTSMLTGLYPSEHGIHENARHLDPGRRLLAERLREAGYQTAAFVSGLPLDRQFGLARGFDQYDDEMGAGSAERDAGSTTDRALAWLGRAGEGPLFLWAHYFDPHDPYEPPEPFRTSYESNPYLGEIAYMDQEIGRLLAGFEKRCGRADCNILVVGDHGESLGEHGEMLHGRLLYQGVMRVPLIVAGSGVMAGESHSPVSTRRVFDTVLGWADPGSSGGLLEADPEPVLGEAMKPYLQYGWQPQVMAVSGRLKVIRSGAIEIYDVVDDPAESRDLAGETVPDPASARALRSYSLPQPGGVDAEERLTEETRERLAGLGYIDSGARPAPRDDAPSPRRMTHLFADMDVGAALFVEQRYAEAIPRLARILDQDPGNLAIALRLAVAHSVLGRDRLALEYFERAAEIDPGSVDLAHYRAMHYLRAGAPDRAAPLFETVLARMPTRLPALRGLAGIRQGQGQPAEAAALLERALALDGEAVEDLVRLGELRMAVTDTAGAIRVFERARALRPELFTHFLELGVCYLVSRRFAEARDSLDRVPPDHPAYPMALFKRAQVSVLLGEPDRQERIRLAEELADDTTRPLIAREPLFAAAGSR